MEGTLKAIPYVEETMWKRVACITRRGDVGAAASFCWGVLRSILRMVTTSNGSVDVSA
jgi:hypothetical protein